MGYPIRPIISDECTILDLDNQFVKLYAIVHPATQVYTAIVDVTPDPLDQNASIKYNTGSGTLGNILPGMTVWVGSSPGTYDIGMARVRKAADSNYIYIGEESQLNIVAGQNLTVIDEFLPWARHIRILDLATDHVVMDYEIEYTNQHDVMAPVVIMGPSIIRWIYDTAAPVTAPFDASESWEPGGASLTYLWTAPGASSTSGLTTATPTIKYNARGVYRVSCTVCNGAATNTGYRYVYVIDDGADFLLKEFYPTQMPAGSDDDGGWAFALQFYGQATLNAIRDRGQIFFFARDFYGDREISLGPVPGRENQLSWGWIDGRTIHWDPEQSYVTFSVKGPRFWMGKVQSFIAGYEDTTAAPVDWLHFQNLNVRKAVWDQLVWRSTISTILDAYVDNNTWRCREVPAPATNLWDQIVAMGNLTILMTPTCDRYGRLYVSIDSQILLDRSGIPVIMDIDKEDWVAPIDFAVREYNPVSQVNLNGVSFDGTTPTPLFALAPGHIFDHFGDVYPQQNLVLPDSATALHLAGLIYGWKNCRYPNIPITLSGNNRFFDIAPNMYATIALDPDETPAGIGFTNINIIPRRIQYAYDAKSGMLSQQVQFESETFEGLSVKGDPPTEQGNCPDGYTWDPTSGTCLPPVDPPPTDVCPVGYHWDPDDNMCVSDNPGGELIPDLVYAFANGVMGRARNFISGGSSVNWEDVTGSTIGSGTGTAFILDPWGPKAGAWRTFNNVLEHTADLDSSPPTWVSQLLATDVQTATGATGVKLQRLAGSITEPGLIYVGWSSTNAHSGISTSADGGATWNHYGIGFGGGGPGGDVFRVIADTGTFGRVYWLGGNGAFHFLIYSPDYGAHWHFPVILGPSFTVVQDFDIDYPTGGCIIVARCGIGTMNYSNDAGATMSDAGLVITPNGGNGGHICMNIATLNQNDVLWVEQVGASGLAEGWHSTDAGATWSSLGTFSGTGDLDGTHVVAMGRWPYDSLKCFWLRKPGGVTPPAARIGYSDDLLATQQDKTGDWATVFGAALDNPVMIIPVWIP